MMKRDPRSCLSATRGHVCELLPNKSAFIFTTSLRQETMDKMSSRILGSLTCHEVHWWQHHSNCVFSQSSSRTNLAFSQTKVSFHKAHKKQSANWIALLSATLKATYMIINRQACTIMNHHAWSPFMMAICRWPSIPRRNPYHGPWSYMPIDWSGTLPI